MKYFLKISIYKNSKNSNFCRLFFQLIITLVCFFLGFCCYGPHTLYGLIVMENAPPGLSGTAHALSAAASSSNYFLL